MTKALRDAAQALLDKLDGRRSFGVELLAAEFADERRSLRAAIAASDRVEPAGDAAMPPLPDPGGYRDVDGDWVRHGHTDAAMKEYAKAATTALQADLVEERNRIAGMRVEWAAEVAALQAEGAKSERRAIEFGDALHRHILAMRAAVVAWHSVGPSTGMQWIANTLAGPGHLPNFEEIRLGAQALFDKEVAEHEAFRAAHPGPGPAASNPSDATEVAAPTGPVPDVAALEEVIRAGLADTYHCTRVWEAWGLGTMSEDDFEPVDESDTPSEIAQAVLALLSASKPAGAATQALREAVQLPDMLAASEAAEPSGDAP